LANTICIAPSILSADFARLGEQVRDAETGGADLIHIDVMDGRFVPNLSFGPLIVDAVRRSTALPLDVHLMILEPDDYLAEFAKAGATAISVHWEACPHLHRSLQRIRDLGCRAGIAINPHTPASLLSEIMHLLDVIIVMTVNPGFGGQSFLPETLPKVGQLRQMITASGRDIALEVDGGINTSTALQAVQAGANVLIAGNGIFNRNHSIQTGIEALRAAARRQ
jgi:ribulose-phosphate 3-epimerase